MSRLPSGLEKIYRRWVKGEKFVSVKAKNSGELRLLDPKPVRISTSGIHNASPSAISLHTIWFPPDDLWKRAEVYPVMKFEAGDDVIRLKVTRWRSSVCRSHDLQLPATRTWGNHRLQSAVSQVNPGTPTTSNAWWAWGEKRSVLGMTVMPTSTIAAWKSVIQALTGFILLATRL